MPGKRSRKTKKQSFNCPCCHTKLWRTGSEKHYIFYDKAIELQKNFGISKSKAGLLMAQRNTYLNRKSWIEKFYCEQHGTMWLKISRKDNDLISIALANTKDWKNTTGTIDPNLTNPSVSEYSYYMSRKPRIKSKNF